MVIKSKYEKFKEKSKKRGRSSPFDKEAVEEVESGIIETVIVTEEKKTATIVQVGQKKPFLDNQGRLRIPLDAPDKYRWWAGGQSVFETLLELKASEQEIEAHIGPIETPKEWRTWQTMKNTENYK